MTVKTTRVAIGMMVLALGFAGAGCGGHTTGGPKAAAADSVLLAASDVATATRVDLASGVPVSGTLAPGVDVNLTSPIDDVLEQVLVREGQTVARGQVLARFRAGTVDADAASAEAQLRVAETDYTRQKNLLKEGAVSQRDVDTAEATWRAAQATYTAAARRRDDATVRSPIAGVVAVRSVQSGDRVSSGDALFRIVNTRELDFEATVPSEFVRDVHPGARVALTVTGDSGRAIDGKVARINATADEATRQVKVYVTVPNPSGRLVGGLFATGNVVTAQARAALAVPGAAVRTDAQGRYSLVVRNGVLARAEIRTGVRDEATDRVQVLEGLSEGDIVVVGPIEGLTAGRPVKITGRES